MKEETPDTMNKTAMQELLIDLFGEDAITAPSVNNVYGKYLELEKQQIIDARVTAPTLPTDSINGYRDEAEQYYTLTYSIDKL